jgi:hypothetical protein
MARNNGRPFVRTAIETLSVAAMCESAIQIVRPLESIAETQPQLCKTQKCLDIFDALRVKESGEREAHYATQIVSRARFIRPLYLHSRSLLDGKWSAARFLPPRSA